MQFTLNDILQDFDSGTFGRGTDYARRGNVLSVVDTGKHIEAAVKGSSGEVYEQEIGWTQGRRGVMFEGSCTCPVGFNCKHVVAALLKYLEQMSSTPAVPVPMSNLPNAVAGWLQRLALAAQLAGAMPTEGKTGKPSKTTYRAIYILMPDSYARRVNLHLCKARLRVNDEVASASPVNEAHSLLSNPPAYVQPVDQYLARLFIAMRSGADWYSGAAAQPRGKIGDQLLRALLDEGRLFWANAQFDLQSGVVYPLKLGPARSGHLRWRWRALEHVNKNGEAGSALQLGWQFDDGAPIDAILPTEPAWYIDNLSIGELTLAQGASAIPIQDLQALVAQAPPVAARDQLALSRQLMAQGLDTIVPLPRALQHVLRSDIKPRPSLLLGSIAHGEDMVGNPQAYDFGTLSFNYDGVSVSIDPAQQALRQSGDSMELIQRDPAAEQAAYQRLTGLGFAAPTSAKSPLRNMKGAMALPSQNDWLRFNRDHLPRLLEQGWLVEKTPDYRFDITQVDDWYAEIDNAWFDLELGIVVNQARVSLLPVLVQMIRQAPHHFNPQALAAHADDDQLLATLPEGTRVALPWGRIKPILSTLGELYFNDKIGESIRLPTLDAARLAELEASAQLRWMGGQHLRDIGHKLNTFGGVQKVAPPAGLHAKLREYQSEGLAWMQFLREYDLAGILADDMGLGKTIQTLAHILTEKEAGRLTAPALVVAPTSLMGNWQAEAARFAPDLWVLLMHGKDRTQYFDAIDQADLVLTTYALLPRDEEKLRRHRYHLVILDESQYIKNSQSKAAQTAALLPAKHRMCLTGTPLQNHLGELWSQFHFLLPGLLGNEKSFNADFRNP
ncbi:MAG: DEAD/DEAH box helicase, partial [Pseudomonadota bacterium]